MKWFDDFFERQTRAVAQTTSRRSALTRIGRTLVGSAFVLPVLPFARMAHAQHGGAGGGELDPLEDQRCEYWRYCSLDGFLVTTCCGSIARSTSATSA